ncbi:ankyrin repeat-containing domain protein [Rhexocercosporidium sp. MPI-PUGE-AT-0058]|nr:ankyrin repeat-containing domain protein [Rhexocercosporidium sp. MPI-PUGE-AT-0058]
MAKDWDRYKTEINALYINNGKSLDDVRRILKGRHNFDASVRAYRMKLEYWGIKKNKVPVGVRSQARPRRKTKTVTIASPSSGAQASNEIADHLGNTNVPNWSQFDNNEAWAQGFSTPALNRTSPPMPSFHDDFNAPYIPPNKDVYLPSGQELFKIISEGTEQELLEHLSFGTSVNIRDNVNNSPLHTAIIRGNIGMAKALLKYGADVDAIGFSGKSPLYLSVVSKNMVQLLLKHQPNLSLQDDEGNSILHYLLRLPNWWSDLDIRTAIKSVLFAGANINIQNRVGESPLHRIIAEVIPASERYMEVVFEFLNCKPDVTTPMRNGQALLGVFLENTSILQKDTEKWSTPEWVKAGFRCLEQFLVAGANPNLTFHSQPLIHYSLESGKIWEGRLSGSFLMHLIEEADLDVAGPEGNFLLHTAFSRINHGWRRGTSFPHCKVTSALIARGVDVNKPNRAGAPPLEMWLARERVEPGLNKVVTLLVDAGASSTVTTTAGKTLFDLLARQPRGSRVFLTRTLLEADIKAPQPENDTVAGSEWVELWRSAWKPSLWSIAKANLTKLDQLDSRPKSKNFMECAFLVIVKRLLERHRSRLKLVLENSLERGNAMEDYEEYCAILRDCREGKADIDASFYTFLLDIMDF